MTLSVNLALAQRLEHIEALNTAGYALALKQFQPQSAAAVLAVANGLATFTRPDFPMNRTVGLGLAEDTVWADALHAVETFYQSHDAPAQVVICPFTHAGLLRALGSNGYFAEQFFNVHARPITPEDADWINLTGIHISIVEPPDFDVWARTNISTNSASLDLVDVHPDEVWFTLCKVAVRRPNVMGFIAWVDGEPAGSAALSIHDGVATLFSAGTRIPYRRRGIQKALLQARLAEASRQGCDLAHITTSPGSDSQRNVQRHGFALLYQRITLRRDFT